MTSPRRIGWPLPPRPGGSYNIAADPVVDHEVVEELLGARTVPVPGKVARTAMAALWRLHVLPAEPALLDLVLSIPLLDTTRIRTELAWEPTVSAVDAMREVLQGMVDHAGGETPTLAPDSVEGRVGEVATGVGESYSTDHRTDGQHR